MARIGQANYDRGTKAQNMGKTNPQYIQDYIKSFKKFPAQWSEEDKQEYIKHAKLNLFDRIIMLDRKNPVVIPIIASLFGAAVTTLILSIVLQLLLK